MHFLILLFSLSVVSSFATASSSGSDQQAIDDFLAVKLKVDVSSLRGVALNKGGGYDLEHSKLELGNFLVNLAYERFNIDWHKQDKLPFATGIKSPVAAVKRYHLKTHIPYRLDERRMWLGHLGAEMAFETQTKSALSLQAYALYSEYLNRLASWQLGVYVNHHPVETVVLPIFEYTYNYPFKQRAGYYGHLGFPKTELGYFIHPKLRTDIGFAYHQATVKLADDSPIEQSGIFQSKNWRASWKLHYQINKQLEARLGVDASVSNKLILYNQDHKMVDHYYGDNGLGWRLGLDFRF